MSTTGSDGDRPACLLVRGQVTDRDGFKACSAALPPIYREYQCTFFDTIRDGLPGAG